MMHSPLVLPDTRLTNVYWGHNPNLHYSDVIMGAMASQISSLTIVYSTVYSGIDQRKHQSSASLTFVRGIHRSPVNSPHKWPVTRKMFPFDDVIMCKIPVSMRKYLEYISICTCHDRWTVVTYAKLWPDHISRFNIPTKFSKDFNYQLLSDEAKWVPNCYQKWNLIFKVNEFSLLGEFQ